MKKLLIISCLVLVIGAGSAFGLIPLSLEAEIAFPITMPPGYPQPWDVQHFMDDSTLGWACVVGDTVYWTPLLGDSVRTCLIPVAQRGWAHEAILCCRVATDTAVFVATVRSSRYQHDGEDAWWFNHVFNSIDLLSDTAMDAFTMRGWSHDSFGNHSWNYYVDFSRVLAWPPLPASATWLIVLRTYRYQSIVDMGGWHESNSTSGDLWAKSVGPCFGALGSVATDAKWIDPFPASGESMFALTGLYRTSGGDVVTSKWWVGTVAPDSSGTALHIVDSLVVCNRQDGGCSQARLCAQQDGDGTRRLVAGGVPAYDATTLQELWSNPSIPTRQSFTARFTDSADERLLVLSSTGRTFSVWDASDGSYLDETASFSGSPQYFLKHFDGESELVTYDAATHTARVYRLTGVPRRVETLSCYFIPGTGCVRLRWGAVEGASAYRIYVGDSVDGAMQLFAEVPSGTEYHYLPTTSDVKFFSVTAVYEEP